jgi:hypothetical protein
MMNWNQYEFIECLGVLPEVDEDETYYSFKIEKDGMRLDLTLFQYFGDVYLDLYRDSVEQSVFSAQLKGCEGARYVNDKNGRECLEFAPAKSFGSRYDGESPIPFGVRVAVNPHIRIELF